MKKISILMLSLVTLPVFGQSVFSTLNKHQSSLSTVTQNGKATLVPVQEGKPTGDSIPSSNVNCTENDQTSLPLAYVTSLIQEKNGALDIIHDPRTGTLAINSPDMISNCSSMLEWKLNQTVIKNEKAYAIEVKIKTGDSCSSEGCSYKVAQVENGGFKEFKPMVFKPTMKGFEECLQKSGVVVGDKVVTGAIYSSPISEKFSGLNTTGNLLFSSHGPDSSQIKAKYGKFEHIAVCDYYEVAHPQIRSLLTFEDAEKQRLRAEAIKLKECKVSEYHKVADFIEKYEGFAGELFQVRDRLILEASKKSAQAISEKKYNDEDLKVLSDFEKYIVAPKVELARALYEESLELEGDAKKAKQAELKKVLAEISALNQKPYFVAAHIHTLINDGKFEEAQFMNSIKLSFEHNQRLGVKHNGVVITPRIASQRIAEAKLSFSAALPVEKEKYDYKTGQQSGKAAYYTRLASTMRENINIRTQNFIEEIMLETQRVQPGGHCTKYWVNAKTCSEDTQLRIRELENLAKHLNGVDAARAKEYDAHAKEWHDLEARGRRYVATQNGEDVSEEPVVAKEENTTIPSRRPQTQEGTYSFNFNQGNQQFLQQQQGQMTPQQYQYPVTPYQNQNMFQQQQNPYAPYMGGQQQYMGQQQPFMGQQQQNPWLGQQAYPFQQQNPYGYQAQGQFNFGYGGGYQQPRPYMPQATGYWAQPNTGYMSMYGR